jgi:quercetin dioxygenase-like cupin family protein
VVEHQPPVPGEHARALRRLLPGPDDRAQGPLFEGDVRARTVHRSTRDHELTVMTTAFAAGAGTVRHVHDGDQVLLVTDGRGALDDDVHGRRPLRAGDLVVVPAGRPHRHLAADDESMTHLSVTAHGENHLAAPDTA